MSEAKKVQITGKTQETKTGAKGEYELFKFTTNEPTLTEFGVFGTKGSNKPRINKKELEINIGDTVALIFERSGKNVKILEAAVQEKGAQVTTAHTNTSHTTTGPAPWLNVTKQISTDASINAFITPDSEPQWKNIKTVQESRSPTSQGMTKDLSMELSGIIQALIVGPGGSNYYDSVPKTLSNGKQVTNTYLNTTLLFTHAKMILSEVKDKLAQERTQTQ